jgi:hypothetical protein
MTLPPLVLDSARRYSLAQATLVCDYRRTATMREKHLSTEADRCGLGHGYDGHGRVTLDADAVERLALQLRVIRAERGNWRRKNLGKWAVRGRRGGRRTRSAKVVTADPVSGG